MALTRVVTAMAVSLDGYVAGPDDGPGRPLGRGGEQLFGWHRDGDTPSRHYPEFRLSAASARFFDAFADRVGAVVSGRRTYEIAGAWGGRGPLPGAAVVVLTHAPPPDPPAADPPYSFVTTGIADAVDAARRAAGDRDVALMGSAPVQQALAAGLLDEVVLHLVPVLLGGGVRLLDGVATPLRCTDVVAAPGVTHLVYEVVRREPRAAVSPGPRTAPTRSAG